MTTVNFYKGKIQEMKLQFEKELFRDNRNFKTEQSEDGEQWKKFDKEDRKS